MFHIKAPNKYSDKQGLKIFLGGSIDMDRAEKWQDKVVESFINYEIVFLNPRRDDFNIALEQSIECQEFVEQVEWELTALEEADVVIFYFDPNGKSPVTMLELGHFGTKNKPVFVCCRNGFWRKGNVDIFCKRYGVEQIEAESVEEFCDKIRSKIIKCMLGQYKRSSMHIRGENGV